MDYNEPFESNQPVQGGKTDVKFDVGLTVVKAFVEILNKDTSGVLRKEVKEITPVVHDGDTLLYIVNYEDNKGWVIISGDKRTSSILAYSAEGAFELNAIKPGVGVWAEDLAEQIYALKLRPVEASDTLSENYIAWEKIEEYSTNIQRTAAPIENPDPNGPPTTPTNDGHWELNNIVTEKLPSIIKGPLLPTKWGQWGPWNTCVPTDAPNSTKRCPTGCTAVAGAQMLYYLHYKLGVPSAMYSTGSCIGWSNNDGSSNIFGVIGNFFSLSNVCDYVFDFSNSTTTTWDQMAKIKPFFVDADATTDRVAVLMGYVGWQIKTAYKGNGSSSTLDNLADFYSAQGIKCDSKGYNSSEALTSLNNNMPVIVRADSRMIDHGALGIVFYTEPADGHAWVIDGYERLQTKYTYYYQWVPAPGTTLPRAATAVYTKTTETVAYTDLLIMNWGYDGSWDDGRYSLDGLWNANGGDHQYRRDMLINFAKK